MCPDTEGQAGIRGKTIWKDRATPVNNAAFLKSKSTDTCNRS